MMSDRYHTGDFYTPRAPNFRLREPIYVAVVGGRQMEHLPVMDWMRAHLDREKHVVVTGDAQGADDAARRFCSDHGFVLVEVPADHLWKHYHNGAGMIRNPIVARLATEFVVAFPDSESRGTHDTVAFAESIGKKVLFPLGNGQSSVMDPVWRSEGPRDH